MDPEFLGNFEVDPSLPIFAPERPNGEMLYCAVQCLCGHEVFRLTGWPRIASGRGGFFWRTLTRVWREARLPAEEGEPSHSPFWLPLSASCDGCGRNETLFDDERVKNFLVLGERGEPREAYRCRMCSRGLVELVVGVAPGGCLHTPSAVEIIARCHSCHRQSRIAWAGGRHSDQEMRLDLLYGRR